MANSLKCKTKLCFLSVLIMFVTVPSSLFGAVERVTLYPQGASVQERIDLERGQSEAELVLPGEANKDTLRVVAGDVGVQSVSQHREERSANPEAIAELKRRIEKLEGKKAEVDNNLRRVGKLIAFYEGKVSAETKGAKATAEMAELLNASLEDLYEKRLAFREESDDVDKDLREAKKRLEELTGAKDTVWRVRVRLEEPVSTASHLQYSYYLESASWAPEYTLNAQPGRERVRVVWTARLVQRTGWDWRNASLHVATMTRRFRPDPPQVREWIIRPVRRDKRAKEARVLSAEAPAKRTGGDSERQRVYSGDVYDLGPTDLPAGEEQRLALRRFSLPARFVHLLRPLETPECFIRAELRAGERMRLPRGRATLELEGAYVGQSAFSMRGKNATVAFGTDRDVTAEVARLTKRGGIQGFFRDQKTYEWGWRFRIANTRDQAVRLRLELPWPRLRSEEIELEPLRDFSQEDVREHRAIKELKIAPSSRKTLEYGIRIVYPKKMNLDFGRF